MPVITLLLATVYLLAIYGLLFLACNIRKGTFSRPKDAS